MRESDTDTDLESAAKEQWNEKIDQQSTQRSTTHLDGLRGLAALIVYLSHTVGWWYGSEGLIEHGFGYHGEHMIATFPFMRSFFSGGAAAVTVFFVMSGYVLSLSSLLKIKDGKVKETRRYALAAAIRRPFRLFMPVAAISFVFALCMHLPFGLAPHLPWPEPQPTLLSELWKWLREFGWTINIFAKHGTFDHWYPYDPPAWTMAAELKGSIVVFGILALSSSASLRQRFAIFGTVGVTLLFLYQWELACFMFGIVLAMFSVYEIKLSHQDLSWGKPVVDHIAFFVGWYLLGQPHGQREPEISYSTPGWYILTMLIPANYYNNEFWRFWNAIGATMLIYGVMNIHWVQCLLQRPTLRFLGKVSFSLYLIHIPFTWTIGDRICRLLGVIRQDFETPYDKMLEVPDIGPMGFSTGFVCWQAIVLPINLILALFATKWIDNPSVKLSKRITTKLGLIK